MLRFCPLLLLVLSIIFSVFPLAAVEQAGEPLVEGVSLAEQASPEETLAMLSSVAELQHNLKEQLALTREKIRTSESAAEKERLESELARLDRQLSDSSHDFERIATGVEIGRFEEKQAETFRWKDEITTLIEPAIKEVKRLTYSLPAS